MPSTVLLVAHGSRVAAAAEQAEVLRALVAESTGAQVLLGHLEIASPLASEVVEGIRDGGPIDGLVVQPLLLLPGNHARFDVAAVARQASMDGLEVKVGQALGSDVRLLDLAAEHVRALLPVDALLVIASGTASDAALRSLDASAALVASAVGVETVAAAPATLDGTVAVEALERLASEGSRRVAVLPWMLFPGRLEHGTTAALVDAADGLDVEVVVAERFGPDPAVAQALVRRIERARPFAG